MKRIFRLSMSVLLAGVLMTFAVSVWAGGKTKAGTVANGTTCGTGGSTTIFSKLASCNPAPQPGDVDIAPSSNSGSGPASAALVGTTDSNKKLYSQVYQQDAAQTVCFAYPPAFAKHNVQINVYSNGSWHPVKSEISGTPAQMCAELPVGSLFAILGDQYLMR